jgi:hypothetical protein
MPLAPTQSGGEAAASPFCVGVVITEQAVKPNFRTAHKKIKPHQGFIGLKKF